MNDPPVATPREETSYELHGQRIADPYRWLEDDNDPRVAAWVSEQNRLVDQTLSALPERGRIRRRLEQLLAIGEVAAPAVRRTQSGTLRYFFTRRDAGQNQPVLLVRDAGDASSRVLVDPNQLSVEGTSSLDWYYPSNDGALVAYGISRDGSEESTLLVLDVDTGQRLADEITRTRHCSVCWKADGKEFFYSRFPAPGSVPAGEEKYHRKIHEHVIGRSPDQDPVVFGEGRRLTEYPSCVISPDGRWLVVRTSDGWSKSELFLADTTAPELGFVEVTQAKSHVYDPLIRNDVLYVSTNEGAPRNLLYAVDPTDPRRERWRIVLAEHESDVLVSFNVISSQILATYLHAGVTRLERFDDQGRSLGAIGLPTFGTSDGFYGLHDGPEAFFDFESFTRPTSIQRLDLESGEVTTWTEIASPISPDDYEVVRGQARSKDGTMVPYLVVRKRGCARSQLDRPTLLYGYGGFNVSLLPRFSRPAALWLERGGVFVQANLRGGGEFGEQWHRAGQLANKQNVFDDFIAVAEHLIAEGLTRPDKLAIYGRSNGGLLVSAALTQRPDLFRAAAAAVPITDMLRYERFLLARLWTPEYGSATDPEQFGWLRAYSPYHQVKAGTSYPAVLLATGISDSRVAPLHARKLAAALQFATASEHPVLVRTELQAGHGAGKPAAKIAEEYADLYTFLLWQLGEISR